MELAELYDTDPDANPETLYPLTITLGESGKGKPINLKYRALTDARASGTFAAQLAATIAEWDLTDQGQPVEPSEQFFTSMTLRFRKRIIEAITEDYFPK